MGWWDYWKARWDLDIQYFMNYWWLYLVVAGLYGAYHIFKKKN